MDTQKETREKRVRARNDAMVDAPAVLTIEGPGGPSVFLCSRAGPQELLALRRWVRSKVKLIPVVPFTAEELKAMSKKERELFIKEFARTRAAGGRPEDTIDQAEAMELLCTPEGVARQVFHSAARNHPGLKLEELQALITPENVAQVQRDFEAATTSEGGDPNSEGPG